MLGELSPEAVALLLLALVFALLLHMLGIYCCCKQDGNLQGQNVVLINLSSVEIVTIIFFMTHLCLHYADYTPNPTNDARGGDEIFCSVYHVVTSLCYGSMLLLPVDRILCIFYPTSYFIKAREKALRKSVAAIWIGSIIWGSSFSLAPITLKEHTKVIVYSTYVSQAIFLFVTFLSYVIIGVSFLPRQRLRTQETDQRVRKTFHITVALITAFTVFVMVPNFIQAASGTGNLFRVLITYIGHSVDPLLYIFLDKSLRPLALSLVTCNRYGSRKNEEETENNLEDESYEVLTSGRLEEKRRRMTVVASC